MQFYVYLLCDQGVPFYVGKGSGNRILGHEREARHGVQSYKCHKIRSIWQAGREVERVKVFVTDDERAAFDLEVLLIAGYRARGVKLCNATDGGEGGPGVVVSQEAREKRAVVTRAMWSDPAKRAHISARIRAALSDPVIREKKNAAHRASVTPEYRAKMRVITRLNSTPELRKKIGEATKRSWQNPASRAKRIAAIAAANSTPEQRAKFSRQMKAYTASPAGQAQFRARAKRLWADPEYRAKMEQQIRERSTTDQERAARKERTKTQWTDPDVRARRLAGMQAANTPEYRDKLRATTTARMSTPEAKAHISATTKASWDNPETRTQRSAGIRAALGTPESQAQRSASQKASWADPETHERRAAAVRRGTSTPEARAKVSAASKASWARRNPKAVAAAPEIRALAMQGWKAPALAKHFDLSIDTVRGIVRNETYTDTPPQESEDRE